MGQLALKTSRYTFACIVCGTVPENLGAGDMEGTWGEHAFCLKRGFSVAPHVAIWSLRKQSGGRGDSYLGTPIHFRSRRP